MNRALLVACVLLGCNGNGTASSGPQPPPKSPAQPAPVPAQPPAEPAKSPAPAQKEKAVSATPIEWSMKPSADGKSLLVNITVTNTTDTPIWVVDRLVAPGPGGKLARTDRLTVMNTDDPKTIRFVAGAVSSDRPSATVYQPTFTEVAKGDVVRRAYTVPLPLTSWNPVGGASPLSTQATHVKLFVHTSRADPARWSTPATSDSQPLRIPEWGRGLSILEGQPLPLP